MKQKIAVVIPAYNEEASIRNVLKLDAFLKENLPDYYNIIIADNNSSDNTYELSKQMLNDRIKYNFVEERGKGAAIRNTWLEYDDYDAYSFMDMDLIIEPKEFPEIINCINKKYDMVIGSRYVDGAKVKRSLKRKIISKTYRIMFSTMFNYGINDPQCGMKAINQNIRNKILPNIENNGFFFDTELIVKSINSEFNIGEIPIEWYEDPNTTVKFSRDVPDFLKGLVKLKYEQISNR